MDELIFLDTETTGADLRIDRLFQVAYKYKGKMYSQYFNPNIPISIKAQSITHITPKMVKDKEEFQYSEMKTELKEILSNNILVAHNAMFDIEILYKEGIDVPRFICTLKVAIALDEECIIPEYNLQYLRYYYEVEIDGSAHEASDDVLVEEAVFNKLYSVMLKKYGDHDTVIKKMIEISQQPILFKMFPFGKHKGKKIEEVLTLDRSYLEWMLDQNLQKGEPNEDWIFTLKFFLKIN